MGSGRRERWLPFEDDISLCWFVPFRDGRGKLLLDGIDDNFPLGMLELVTPFPTPLHLVTAADDNDLVTGWFDANDVSILFIFIPEGTPPLMIYLLNIVEFSCLSSCFKIAGWRIGVGSIEASGLSVDILWGFLPSQVLPFRPMNGLFRLEEFPFTELNGFDLPIVLNFSDVNGLFLVPLSLENALTFS